MAVVEARRQRDRMRLEQVVHRVDADSVQPLGRLGADRRRIDHILLGGEKDARMRIGR